MQAPHQLINCTARPVFVAVDGHAVELPRHRHHITIVDEISADSAPLTITIDGATTTVGLLAGDVDDTIGLPPAIDGVIYLVDAEVLLRCPHRSDFVTAGHYQGLPDDGHLEHGRTPVVLSTVRRALATVDNSLDPGSGSGTAEPAAG
jgi:hypothetical protein